MQPHRSTRGQKGKVKESKHTKQSRNKISSDGSGSPLVLTAKGYRQQGRPRNTKRIILSLLATYISLLPVALASFIPSERCYSSMWLRNVAMRAATMGRSSRHDQVATSAASAHQNHDQFFKLLFRFDLPEGLCMGIQMNQDFSKDEVVRWQGEHWLYHYLHADEIQYGLNLDHDHNAHEFFLGRLAMRQTLQNFTCETISNGQRCDVGPESLIQGQKYSPILKDEYGRPTVPKGFVGSISHKRSTAVALVEKEQPTSSGLSEGSSLDKEVPVKGIGVDIEDISRKTRIAKRVLTQKELNNVGNLASVSAEEEVLLRFSLKESVYKAIHPIINKYVGFQEGEVTPFDDGTAKVRLNIKGANRAMLNVTAHWRKVDDQFFLTSASARRN